MEILIFEQPLEDTLWDTIEYLVKWKTWYILQPGDLQKRLIEDLFEEPNRQN